MQVEGASAVALTARPLLELAVAQRPVDEQNMHAGGKRDGLRVQVNRCLELATLEQVICLQFDPLRSLPVLVCTR